jgi:Icc-related predicted phosphoesterase
VPYDIDMIIHSGDCSNPRDPYNNEPEVRDFIDWFKMIPVKYKIYVAGNHDTSIEKKFVTKKDFENAGVIYLENESVEIEGIKFFGSPHTPQFGQWAFMKDRVKLERFWRMAIPEDTDVIITHGPPRGVLDKSYDKNHNMESCGDKSLLNRILEVQPAYCLFGHIHNCKDIINAGITKLSTCDAWFSNGSVVTDGKFGKLTSNGNIIEIV